MTNSALHIVAPAPVRFLRGLASYGRVAKLYAPGHLRIRHHLGQLQESLQDVFSGARAELRVDIREGCLFIDEPDSGIRSPLAHAAARRGIRSLVFKAGAEIDEVVALTELLHTQRRAIADAGGTREYLDRLALAHVEVVLDTAAAGETRQAGVARARKTDPEKQQRAVEETRLARLATETLRAQMRNHNADETAARALCGLLSASAERREYEERRALVFRAVQASWFGRKEILQALALLAHDTPSFESPLCLVMELAATTRDEELLTELLAGRRLDVHTIQAVAATLARRPDACALLSFLARSPIPTAIRNEFGAAFAQVAERHPSEFLAWARRNRGEFVHDEVLAPLLDRVPSLAGSVVRDLLLEGGSRERRAIAGVLAKHGSRAALRMLVLGVPHGYEDRDEHVITAIGRFPDPLAVGMLREVIHRCNDVGGNWHEAEAAVSALSGSRHAEARRFLDEIRSKRSCLVLPHYRAPLRRLAERALARNRDGGADGSRR